MMKGEGFPPFCDERRVSWGRRRLRRMHRLTERRWVRGIHFKGDRGLGAGRSFSPSRLADEKRVCWRKGKAAVREEDKQCIDGVVSQRVGDGNKFQRGAKGEGWEVLSLQVAEGNVVRREVEATVHKEEEDASIAVSASNAGGWQEKKQGHMRHFTGRIKLPHLRRWGRLIWVNSRWLLFNHVT